MKPTTTNQLARAIAPYVATILSVSLAVTLRVEHSCSNGPVRATEPTSPGVMTGAAASWQIRQRWATARISCDSRTVANSPLRLASSAPCTTSALYFLPS
jgi:hypothetical protein